MSKCPSFSLVRYNSWHWLKHNKDLAPHVNWLQSFLWLPYWLMPQLNQPHYASRNEPGINLPFSSPGTVALRRCEGRGWGWIHCENEVKGFWRREGIVSLAYPQGKELYLPAQGESILHLCRYKHEFLSTQCPSLFHNFHTTSSAPGTGHRDNLHQAKELSALFMGTKVMVHGLPCEDTDPATFWVTSYGNNLDYYI